jgi:hypothetical protein
MQVMKTIRYGAILLLAAGLNQACEAQSKEETLQWIKMKLPGAQASYRVNDGVVSIDVSYSNVVVNGCSLSYTETTDMAGPGGNKEKIVSEILPLSQLSSARYIHNYESLGINVVQVEATNKVISYKWRETGSDETGSAKDPENGDKTYRETQLALSDSDLAQRLAKALSHAIELCGGKKEAF